MHCTNLGRRTVYAPHGFGQLFVLFLFVLEQVCDRGWELLHFLGVIEEVHLIVAIPHFIREAACPCFDLVELMSFLIVSGLAYVNLDVGRQAAGSSFEVAGCEHDKTPSFNFVNRMIPISSSLDDFIGKEVFVESVNGLLWSIIPAYVYHRLSVGAAVGSIDLSGNWFGEVVRIPYVNPVADLVQLAVVQDAVRYGNFSLVVCKIRIRFGLFNVVQPSCFDLQSDCVLEYF